MKAYAAAWVLFLTMPTLVCGVDISTAQIDQSRTMANSSEIYLTTSNVNVAKFGRIAALGVDGAIFTQPLYLQGLAIANQTKNVVYVATSHNKVYAFDADGPNASNPIWTANLGPYDNPPTDWITGMGVMSTPLIVRSLGAIYVVAATVENGTRVFKLHALDLITGTEKFSGPSVIMGKVKGTAGDAVKGFVSFAAKNHMQRTGLALSKNNIVIAFGADRDIPPYHGWLFSYDTQTLLQTGIFNVTRNNITELGAGIWQSGRAPAVASDGSIYLETGNGNWNGTTDFGQSFLKLTIGKSGLRVASWFTPNAWNALNQVDWDLSSTGTTLIPGTNQVFGGSKDGTIYLLSTSNLGGITTSDTGANQKFIATIDCPEPKQWNSCHQVMGNVFWSTATIPTLYLWGVHDVLRTYTFNNSNKTFLTTGGYVGSQPTANYPGGVLSLSSYLATPKTGILWAITAGTEDPGYFGPGFTTAGTLHALDATNPSTELWNSTQDSARDDLGYMASFTPPITVNGKVYVPTFSNQLVVYGLITGPVPGDVNGDSVVNCDDVFIVKASYGKRTGDQGFDLRADVNSDGVVDIKDLSAVQSHLSSGVVCP
jgi:dockerin type I repeat protein